MDPKLSNEISEFAESLRAAYRKNNRVSRSLVVSGILLSSGVTIGGIFRVNPEYLGVLGAVLSIILTVDRAFAFGERAGTLRNLYVECLILARDDEMSDADARAKLKEIRLRRAQSHTGEGLRVLLTK